MGIYKNNNNNLELIAGGTLYADAPLGTVFALLTTQIPKGFILCDDTVYNKADYPELWELLPNIVKDTTNETFTIDLRESTLKGVGLTGHTVGAHLDNDGLALGEFLDDRIQNMVGTSGIQAWHVTSGSGVLDALSTGLQNMPSTGSSGYSANVDFDASRVARTGATTEVKSTGVNYIMKAKQVSVPLDISEYIRKQNSPDWNNAIEISANELLAGYVVPSDGWVVGTASPDAWMTITVNGVKIAESGYASAMYRFSANVQVKVSEGNVFKSTVAISGYLFVPHL